MVVGRNSMFREASNKSCRGHPLGNAFRIIILALWVAGGQDEGPVNSSKSMICHQNGGTT